MHIKLVDRMQEHSRLVTGAMARETAQTKWAVDGILDLVHAASGEIERNRRLPDSVVAALRHTGINRLLIPAALGGMEAPITDVMDIMERIAAVDGSAGWCAAIGAGSNLFAGYMPATGAGTVFADPDQLSLFARSLVDARPILTPITPVRASPVQSDSVMSNRTPAMSGARSEHCVRARPAPA